MFFYENNLAFGGYIFLINLFFDKRLSVDLGRLCNDSKD